ncbi:MAG: hypothetical protein Q8P15_02150 [Nanoarchaeota archaeon]|nr:hypothetical protein [Nanoarchaeota archaeon]
MTLSEELIESCKNMKGKRYIDRHNGKEYIIIRIDIGKGEMHAEYEGGLNGNFGLKYHLDDEPI